MNPGGFGPGGRAEGAAGAGPEGGSSQDGGSQTEGSQGVGSQEAGSDGRAWRPGGPVSAPGPGTGPRSQRPGRDAGSSEGVPSGGYAPPGRSAEAEAP